VKGEGDKHLSPHTKGDNMIYIILVLILLLCWTSIYAIKARQHMADWRDRALRYVTTVESLQDKLAKYDTCPPDFNVELWGKKYSGFDPRD